MKTVRIGCGAGYSGDRIDPAVELAARGTIGWLVFECLAERTIALAQKARRIDPTHGFDPLLEERMEAVLPLCVQNGIRIVSNMGAANPLAAVHQTKAIAQSLGLPSLRIAAVTGDDVLPLIRQHPELRGDELVGIPEEKLVSANAYLGAQPIVEALRAGAHVVLTGRVADPALFLAILIHEFGWPSDDWTTLGQGTVIGHLLECAGQLTGGYFADPGLSDVPNLARLGFPIAEVREDGSAVLSKVEGSGGFLSRATCIEQLLYEIQDPSAYLTPDVVADFSHVSLEETAPNRVHVSGGRGAPRPDTLKVSVGYEDGFIGEGQISWAGPGALARARLARDILAERLAAWQITERRFDFIGLNAIHGEALSPPSPEPWEVRLRATGRSPSKKAAAMIPREVEALYTNGPASGGGVTGSVRETIAIASTLIPRDAVHPAVHYEES